MTADLRANKRNDEVLERISSAAASSMAASGWKSRLTLSQDGGGSE